MSDELPPTAPRKRLRPCCARREAQVTRSRQEVQWAARKANRWPSSLVLQEKIAKAKEALAQAIQARDDHFSDDSLEH